MGFMSRNRDLAFHFSRQGTLYNLTLDEVQNQLASSGTPLNSMNLDEFLKTVVATDKNPHQIGSINNASSSSSSSSSSAASFFPGNLNLTRTLNRKFEDDMRTEIVQQDQGNVGGAWGGDGSMQRQPELEITLEDFLVHAGVINKGNGDAVVNPQPLVEIDPMVVALQQADWLQYQVQQQQQQMTGVLGSCLPGAASLFGNPVVDVGYSDNHMALSVPMSMIGATSSDLHAPAERKHRFSDDLKDETIERRQKRMIKNRVSAARSRARKQAYTSKLEHELLQLRESNERLEKLKEMDRLLPLDSTPQAKYQLRRTSSAPF